MKFRLSIWACVLIALALTMFGLLFGTVRGYMDEQEQVNALLRGDNGLLRVMEYRGADGLNLCVVAERHMRGDESVSETRSAAAALRDESLELSEKKLADARLDEAVAALAQKLEAIESFKASRRDSAYLDMLRSDMTQLSQSTVIKTYNDAAEAFNRSLDRPLSGFIAKTLGVKPCEIYK